MRSKSVFLPDGLNSDLEVEHGWNKDLLWFFPKDFNIQHEGQIQEVLWKVAIPIYEYLYFRTFAYRNYDHRNRVIEQIEKNLGCSLPFLQDDEIFMLNEIALKKAYGYWVKKYPHKSPYHRTEKERNFASYLQNFLGIASNSNQCEYFPEILPQAASNNTQIGPHLVIGPFVVDIALPGRVFEGIDTNNFTSTIIEVNGAIHYVEKGTNDERLKDAVQSLGFMVWDVENHHIFSATSVSQRIEKCLSSLKAGPERKIDSRRVLSQMRNVALRNIATWLSFDEVERLCRSRNLELSLSRGFEGLKAHKKCPSLIKKEYRRDDLIDTSMDFENLAHRHRYRPRKRRGLERLKSMRQKVILRKKAG